MACERSTPHGNARLGAVSVTELLEHVRHELEFIFAETVEEVLEAALSGLSERLSAVHAA